MVFLHTVASLWGVVSCSEPGLRSLSSDECTCSGSQLQLACTAVGAGSTVWIGDALPDGCPELLLLHSRFSDSDGTTISCPDNSFTARSISVDGECYTSQLTATVTSDLNGTVILCTRDNGSVVFTIDTYTFDLVTG